MNSTTTPPLKGVEQIARELSIEERLRARLWQADPLCEAAADEIARLKAALLSNTDGERIRREALEEAAARCDALAEECWTSSDFGPSRSPGSCYEYAAKNIRALISTPLSEGE